MSSSRITMSSLPLQISGCQLWLDAADSTTVSVSGGSVANWRDKSGRGYIGTSTAGRNFTYATSILNGLNCVQTATGQTLSIPSFALPASMSVFLLYYPISQGTASPFLEQGPDANGNSGFYLYSGGFQTYFINNGGSGTFIDAGNVTVSNTWQLIEGINKDPNASNTMSFYTNGTLRTSGGNTTTNNTTTATLFINGRNNTNTVSVASYIAEILIYNVALTNVQRQQIEGYLAWKWGLQGNLPASHPFKSNPPVGTPTALPVPMTNAVSFRPTQISGCALWLDGADPNGTGVLSANNAAISRWVDKSGNGTSVLQATSSNQPVFQINSFNGLPSLNFPAISRNNIVCLDTAAFNYGTTNRTSFFVLRNNWVSGTPGSSPHWFWPKTGNGSAAQSFVGWISSVNRSSFTGPGISAPIGSGFVLTDVFGASVNVDQLYANGNPNSGSSVTQSGAYISATSGYRIGGLDNADVNSSAYWFDGNIGEILLYNVSLTLAQRQQVEGYLAWKWGLTASLPNGHPYKTPPFLPFSYGVRNQVQRTWLPTQISTSSLWFDGADPTSVTLSGTKVSQWRNKGLAGASFHISQSTDALRPSYTSGVGLVFTASASNVMSNAVPPTYSTAINSYIVFTPNNTTRMRMLKLFGNSVVGSVLDTTIPSMFLSGNAYYYNAFSITASTRYLQSQNIYSASSRSFSLNFTEQTNLTSDLPSASSSLLSVGGEATVFYDGTIHEIITFDGYLSVQQRQQVEGYLAWKWGLQSTLPIQHPFKYAPPSPP